MNDAIDKVVKRIYAVRPKPGDTLVLEVKEWELTPEEAARLHADLKPHFPDNDILVLTDLSLSVRLKADIALIAIAIALWAALIWGFGWT